MVREPPEIAIASFSLDPNKEVIAATVTLSDEPTVMVLMMNGLASDTVSAAPGIDPVLQSEAVLQSLLPAVLFQGTVAMLRFPIQVFD